MKAPEKLYIGRRNYGPLIGGWESQPFSSKEIESIEYIRKDALLEWLDGKMTIEGATEGFVGGYDRALKDVIDKLNSL